MRAAWLLLASLALASAFAPSERDLERAARDRPRAHATASGAAAIRATLNRLLVASSAPASAAAPSAAAARFAPCAEHSLAALVRLEADLHALRDATLVALAEADGRRAPFANAREMAASRARLLAEAARGGGDRGAAARDALCHAVAMSWAHHLSEDAREHVTQATDWVLPLLPEATLADGGGGGGGDDAPPPRGDGPAAAAALASSVTCQIGHEATAQPREARWEGFPHWPSEARPRAPPPYANDGAALAACSLFLLLLCRDARTPPPPPPPRPRPSAATMTLLSPRAQLCRSRTTRRATARTRSGRRAAASACWTVRARPSAATGRTCATPSGSSTRAATSRASATRTACRARTCSSTAASRSSSRRTSVSAA